MSFFQELQYRTLCGLFPSDPNRLSGNAYAGKSKLKVLLGEDVLERLRGKVVVDFGCGHGDQTIELAQNGAGRAVGIDIREAVLEDARRKAAGVANAEFVHGALTPAADFADFVLSIDAFEHFANPEDVLRQIHGLLKPGGSLLVSFGPPWQHPYGGHTFSPFPWAHLVLSEAALCRWCNAVHHTDVSRFEETSGGLNRMTVARFDSMARSSPFSRLLVTPVPIRKLRKLHCRATREFFTAVVRAELVKELEPS